MPYPNALMQATPRNALLGRLSDALAYTYSPERTQQAQQLAQFLSVPAISRTLDKLSYGEPLTTGAGGLGGTTRFNNDALEAAMTIAPMVGPAARLVGKGAVETGKFVAPKAGQLAEQYMVKTGGILPLDVYHGTPHTLPPTARNPLGEFDASKIGTGEGAQVYGHGIYTAESPNVADWYRSNLTPGQYDVKSLGINGQKFKRLDFPSAINARDGYGSPKFTKKQQEILDSFSTDELRVFSDIFYSGDVGKLKNRYAGNSSNSSGMVAGNEKRFKILEKLEPMLTQEKKGSLYKVDLPDKKIARMLDWDKHLSEQAPEVQNILLPYQKEIGSSFGTGEQTLKAIAFERRMKGLDDSPAAVAQQLREMGIPGIKYLDESSRNLANTWIVKHPQGGENVFSTKESAEAFLRKYPEDKSKLIEPKVTRNFVTFPGEEKSMTILERNGQKFDNSALMK